jgi:hypothetical protein
MQCNSNPWPPNERFSPYSRPSPAQQLQPNSCASSSNKDSNPASMGRSHIPSSPQTPGAQPVMAIPVAVQGQTIQNHSGITSGTAQGSSSSGGLGSGSHQGGGGGAGSACGGAGAARVVDINDIQHESWNPLPKLPSLQEFKSYQDLCVKVTFCALHFTCI